MWKTFFFLIFALSRENLNLFKKSMAGSIEYAVPIESIVIKNSIIINLFFTEFYLYIKIPLIFFKRLIFIDDSKKFTA